MGMGFSPSRRVSLLALLVASSVPYAVDANPTGGSVAAGSASLGSDGSTLTVTQSSDKAIIDWRGFDISDGETTNFKQPSSNSMTLNRVNSASASMINGVLSANGKLVIVNQNGVLFGKNSVVNVNSLLATTADIDNDKFMVGGKLSFNKPGNPNATIENQGLITAEEAGLVGLVAPNVLNSGIINAKLGRVHLASGDTATVDFYGDGLLEVQASSALQSQLVENIGTINAGGGTIAMTSAAAEDTVNSLIHVGGELNAPAIGTRNGNIYIYAEGSNAVKDNVAAEKGKKTGSSAVLVDGYLNTSGRKKGERGGSITVTGDNVALLNGATIDASGADGASNTTAGQVASVLRVGSAGGNIRIGGDYLGQGTTPTAKNLYVAPYAFIFNDALNSGDAGRSIFWSDGGTQFYGNVYARALGGLPSNDMTAYATAGGNSGEGGFVETSGHEYLDAGGYVDLTSSNGKMGTYFLDPTNISIYGNVTPAFNSSAAIADGTQVSLSSSLKLWLDASDTSNVILTYNSLGTTATGTSGASTITVSANTNLAIGARIRLGGAGSATAANTLGADTYTITNISGTTITLSSPLTTNYSGSGIYQGYISQLTDKSGLGNNATQSTASGMPLWISNGQNGLGVAKSDANSGMNISGVTGLSASSIFVLYTSNSSPVGARLAGYLYDFYIQKGGTTGPYQSGSVYNSGVLFDTASYRIASNIFASPTSLQVYFNGAQVLSGNPAWGTTYAITTMDNSVIGTLPEFIVYNTALSANAQALVNQFQAAKWGVALSGPGVIGSEAGLTGTEAQTAMASTQAGATTDGYSVFAASYLTRLSASSNIILQASNNINLDLQGATLTLAAGKNITLTAGNQILTDSVGGITTSQSAGVGGNITFSATNGIVFNHTFALNSGGGAITLVNPVTLNAVVTADAGTGTVALGSGGVSLGLSATGFSGKLDLSTTANLTIGGTVYTIIKTLGSAGSTTGTDLQGMAGNLSRNYVLGIDIDASGTSSWNSGAGFAPVTSFTGALNGLGHTITGLFINRTTAASAGLFASSSGALSNVGLVGVNITALGGQGQRYVGIGGVVGFNTGTLNRVYSTGSVHATGTGGVVGGLVGAIDSGTISYSYSTATVAGGSASSSWIGGLIGGMRGGTISNSYATGNASLGSIMGGLVGANLSGTISNCYATGNANGNWGVGGLVGDNDTSTAYITNSYATGIVSGSAVGGLVGNYVAGPITSSYWNTTTSGTTLGLGAGSTTGVTGLTTAQMETQSNFSGWDFTTTWAIISGVSYPYFQWSGAQSVISGTSNLGSAQTIQAVVNGVAVGSGLTGADGSIYIILPQGIFGPGSNLLLYNVGGGANAANEIYIAGGNSASGLVLTSGTLLANSGNGVLTNTALATALGSLTSSDILYTASGNNLTITAPMATFKNDSTGGITINGTITTSGIFGITSSGTVTQSAAITASSLLLQGSGGTFTLTNASNSIGTLAGNTGTVSLTDASSLIVGTVNGVSGLATSGAISLTTTGASHDIFLNNSLSVTGSGSITLSSYHDVFVGSSMTMQGGALILQSNNAGVAAGGAVDIESSTINTNGGNITIGGGSGTITAGSGYAVGDATYNFGVLIAAATLNSGAGNIIINGLGYTSGSLGGLYGIYLVDGAVLQTTSGNISINGVGGGGVDHNIGLVVEGVATQITTATGAISLIGTGGNIGSGYGYGMNLQGSSTISATGSTGTITITGIGADYAIGVGLFGTTVSSVNGGINITGVGSNAHAGILFYDSNNVISTGSAAITLTATNTDVDLSLANYEGFTNTIGGASATGNITFNADTIEAELLGTLSVHTAGTMTIKPRTASTTMGIGSGSGTLSVADTLLSTMSAGSFVFGSASAGLLTVNTTHDFGTSNVTFISGSTISLPATTLTTTGGNIAFNSSVVLSGAAVINAGSGSETFLGAVNGNYNLTATAGTFSFGGGWGGTTPVSAVSLTSTNALSLPSISATSILARTTGATSDLMIASGSMLTASGTGDALTLAAKRNFINSSGSGAFSMTGGGRWLVYSTTPEADTFGNLNSNNTAIWNATYGGTIAQTGNRYIFSYQPTVTFSSTNDSKTYGADYSATVALDYIVGVLQTGVSNAFLSDTNTTAFSGTPSVTSLGSAASAGVAGSPYAITVAQGSLVGVNGYALAFSSTGLLTVNKAALSVTAESKAMTYGGVMPGLTVSYSGFVNGDVAPTVAPSVASGTVASADAGTYAGTLVASGAADANYTISYVAGDLTIGKAALTVITDNKAGNIGAASPIFTGRNNLIAWDVPLISWGYGPIGYSGAAGLYQIAATANDPQNRLVNYSITEIDGTFVVSGGDVPEPPRALSPYINSTIIINSDLPSGLNSGFEFASIGNSLSLYRRAYLEKKKRLYGLRIDAPFSIEMDPDLQQQFGIINPWEY